MQTGDQKGYRTTAVSLLSTGDIFSLATTARTALAILTDEFVAVTTALIAARNAVVVGSNTLAATSAMVAASSDSDPLFAADVAIDAAAKQCELQ